MKKLLFNNKIVYGLLLIFLLVNLQACSEDGTEDLKTFLETYDDTSWKFTDSNTGGILYAKINNNLTNPFEIWLSFFKDSCFIYQSLEDDGTIEVIENSESKLEIKIVDNAQEYSIITLMIVGNTLTATNEDYEDGALVDKNIFILLKTSDDLSNLEICTL